MGAGKNKTRRKKRISKHVVEAEERRRKKEVEERRLLSAADGTKEARAGDGDGDGDGPSTLPRDVSSKDAANDAEKSNLQSPKSSSSKTKDPEEAAAYLAAWHSDKLNGTHHWKFNKNAQSWLLRHMYDFDKVSKSTFAMLVDYVGSGGEGARNRVEEEAKRRARRYKGWEKGQKSNAKGEDEEGDENEAEKDEDGADGDTKEPSAEERAWKELDDHDKRKEYKRARKVLDALKAAREETKESDGQ